MTTYLTYVFAAICVSIVANVVMALGLFRIYRWRMARISRSFSATGSPAWTHAEKDVTPDTRTLSNPSAHTMLKQVA